jgi:hypothetical protein
VGANVSKLVPSMHSVSLLHVPACVRKKPAVQRSQDLADVHSRQLGWHALHVREKKSPYSPSSHTATQLSLPSDLKKISALVTFRLQAVHASLLGP